MREPSVQCTVTRWPRPASPWARSATSICAPPAGAGTGSTGDATTAILTSGSYGRDLRGGRCLGTAGLVDVRAVGHREVARRQQGQGADLDTRKRAGRGALRRRRRRREGPAGTVLDVSVPAAPGAL